MGNIANGAPVRTLRAPQNERGLLTAVPGSDIEPFRQDAKRRLLWLFGALRLLLAASLLSRGHRSFRAPRTTRMPENEFARGVRVKILSELLNYSEWATCVEPSFGSPIWCEEYAFMAAGCQAGCQDCSRNVRSSSLSNIESSAFRACMEHDGIDRGAVDVSKGTGPAQGPARSQKTAHHAKAGRGRVGA